MNEGIASIITALIAAAASLTVAYWKDKNWKRSYRPNRLKQGVRKNTVLIIGTGRVGKTQLLDTLTEEQPMQKSQITNDFYLREKEEYYKKKKIKFYFTDYRGQNFSQLISSFIQEQLLPKTVLRYGDINSVILVVDLFEEEKEGIDPNKQYQNISSFRIEEHVKEWNRTALDAVFGLLTKESLQFVCLFVNKVDKLENSLSTKNEKEIRLKYKTLVDDLKIRTEKSNATFKLIVGSALKGINIIGAGSLMSELNKFSVPKDNSDG